MLFKDAGYLFLLMLIVALLLITLFITKRRRRESYFNSTCDNTDQEADSESLYTNTGAYEYPNDSSFVYDKSNYSMCKNIDEVPSSSESSYADDTNICSWVLTAGI